MGSSGGLSFIGIGDIIKQVRKFIKDISFRNKQEKVLGQLEIINKASEVMQETGFAPSEIQSILRPQIASILNQHMADLLSLESKGKLTDISESINFLPSA
jgi:hypothetical protein